MKSFQAVILAAILLLQSYSTSMSYSYSGKGGKSGGGKGGKSGSKGGKSDSYSYSTSSMSYGSGGGGCAWPLDQFLCPQGSSLVIKIKYTVCPTADEVGEKVGELDFNGPQFLPINMIEYYGPIGLGLAFRDQFGSINILRDDGTVQYGSFIYSATYC